MNFVSTFILSRVLQQTNISICSGFRYCEWNPQVLKAGSAIFITKWIKQVVVYEQFQKLELKLTFSCAEIKGRELTIVSWNHEKTLNYSLTKVLDAHLVFWIKFSNKLLRIIGNADHRSLIWNYNGLRVIPSDSIWGEMRMKSNILLGWEVCL